MQTLYTWNTAKLILYKLFLKRSVYSINIFKSVTPNI